MPELPEVETIRRDLQRLLPGRQIKTVTIRQAGIVRGSAKTLPAKLKGRTVKRVARRGKLLLLDLDQELTILIHLKMTGQLFFYHDQPLAAGGHGQSLPVEQAAGKPGKHTHVSLTFTDGAVLHFTDLRRFGYLALVDAAGRAAALAAFGPEAPGSAFTAEYLWERLKRKKTAVKNALLDQSLVAGLGNIYVDEAAHQAKVRPMRRADRLSKAEVGRLHQASKKILAEAITLRGTSFNDYRDARGKQGGYLQRLKVYGRAGQKCQTCRQADIKKTKVNGRGTHYCPACQR